MQSSLTKDRPKWNRLGKLMPLLWMAFLVTACSSNPMPSPKPLPPPIVSCGESLADEPLPDYPKLHIRMAGEADSQYIGELEADRTASVKWAVIVAGITQRNAIRRNTTAECIANLRRQGVIY